MRYRKFGTTLPTVLYVRVRQKVRNAHKRCYYERDVSYKHYGGRGIEIRFASLQEFFDYLLTLLGWWDPHLVLDRIENDGHYEAGNLRFVTRAVSVANRRIP